MVVGSEVIHKHYGPGKVVEIKDADGIIVVEFQNGKTKSLSTQVSNKIFHLATDKTDVEKPEQGLALKVVLDQKDGVEIKLHLEKE